MTVAPQWPQDGNRQPNHEGSGVAADDFGRPSALPPTLFKLPNLNHTDSRSAGSAADSVGTSQHNVTADPSTPSLVAKLPFTAAKPSGVDSIIADSVIADSVNADSTDDFALTVTAPDRSDEERTYSDEEQRSPVPAPVETEVAMPKTHSAERQPSKTTQTPPIQPTNTVASDRAKSSADAPAGRSWMDSIGSHGIVVGLLLVVVAAALITGRGSNDDDVDASLAESSDWLDFDEGSEVTLPLPSHAVDSGTKQDVSSLDEPKWFAQDDSYESDSPPGNPLLESLGLSGAAGQDSMASGSHEAGGVADVTNQSSAVSLDPPLSTSLEGTIPSQLDHSGVQMNEFVNGPTSVEVLAAANRVPLTDHDNTGILPSLEELAGEHYEVNQYVKPAPSAMRRVRTSTPTGIQDWSIYLKELPDPGSELGTSPVPSPSN